MRIKWEYIFYKSDIFKEFIEKYNLTIFFKYYYREVRVHLLDSQDNEAFIKNSSYLKYNVYGTGKSEQAAIQNLINQLYRYYIDLGDYLCFDDKKVLLSETFEKDGNEILFKWNDFSN